jgi:hypothetical protein
MERFSVTFFSLVLILVVVCSFAFASWTADRNVTLGDRALYTTEFNTSKSNASGKVLEVYANKDKTKAFCLFQFDDISRVSTDAKNYQAFLTACTLDGSLTDLVSKPAGSLYVFGNTGYMGIYLVNSSGFETQILDVVIRANAEIVPYDSTNYSDDTQDASFLEYDQFRINFNPGAAGVKPLACLDADKAPSASDFYLQTVIALSESEAKEALDAKLAELKADLAAIDEFEARIVRDGLQIPATPVAIAGDSVSEDENGILSLETSFVVAKGFGFDWRTSDVETGYLKFLRGTMTNEQFFAKKAKEESGDNDFRTTDLEWLLKDGTDLEDLNVQGGEPSEQYKTAQADTQALIGAWTKYYQDKTAYQVDLLGGLLDIEYTIDFVKASSTVNTSENVILCY